MVCRAVNLVFWSNANLVCALASFIHVENPTMNLSIWPQEKPQDLIDELMSVLKKIPNFNKLPDCIKSKTSRNVRCTIILCTA